MRNVDWLSNNRPSLTYSPFNDEWRGIHTTKGETHDNKQESNSNRPMDRGQTQSDSQGNGNLLSRNGGQALEPHPSDGQGPTGPER